ncbi:MAG: 3-deoxy-manno-octulosonate cytidylyltransferase [Prevotellaceae bacterium]|nr:3-deoxy-manno-octulosonate cytidylyltransferase [Prevotellaceae bacterium]
MENLTFLGIIPARYASTRFPGKPLALLGGKPVIQHVCERVEGLLDDCIVATDDERIRHAVTSFGGRAVMTSPSHRSGTDRCWEAYVNNGKAYDVVVNIQGDEPFIAARQIEAIKQCFGDPSTQIATLVRPFHPEDGIEKLLSPNSPKVVVDKDMRALYFSRSVVPYLRDTEQAQWLSRHTFYKHIGLYAYRTQTLREITSLPQGTLEKAESLEQLRWLENGYVIKVGVCDVETIGIDTPDDLKAANERIARASERQKAPK